MKVTDITNKASRTFHKVGFTLKKHSPEIMTAVGVVGVVASAVVACKATTKVGEIVDESKAQVEDVHEAMEKGKTKAGKEYSEEDSKKDLAIIYIQTGVKMAKLYAPAVIFGGLSIASIIKGHDILRKRNIALGAAYAAIDKSFKEYRGRVVERFGKDLDRELRYNIKAQEIEVKEVDSKGKEKVSKTTVNVIDPNTIGDFARIYDDGNVGWTKDPEHNLIFLKSQQRFCNEKLQQKGYLFLNDVYELLGYQKTWYGQIVGWIYDEEHPLGDNFVDFGIYDPNDKQKNKFVNGYERNIVLDFNVDGNILQHLPHATGNEWRDMYDMKF